MIKLFYYHTYKCPFVIVLYLLNIILDSILKIILA